ncbi:MAG: hypothetical protein GWP10_07240 [Nitrospiraceae bacterium]|nr:hypothetical protein [Nitrospiraceae bacterium]
MAITLYKKRNGKIITTRKSSESGASYAISNYGWSRTKPSLSRPKPAPVSRPAPRSAPARDTSQKTVYKNGQSTIIQGWELPNYQSQGYSTSNNYRPTPTPAKDTSNQEVYKDGKKTTVQAWEVPSYVQKGYTSGNKSGVQEPAPQDKETANELINKNQEANEALKMKNEEPAVRGATEANGLVDKVMNEPKPITPVEQIGQVFGDPNWKPSPIFDQLGLTQQGIYGAVRVGDKVWTIGPGGSEMSPESYKKMFGRDITDTAGIVGDVTPEEAVKLGIVIPADSLLEDLKPWGEMTADEKGDWYSNTVDKEEAKKADKLKKERDKSIQNIIDKAESYASDKWKATQEKSGELGMDEKSKAIEDAQKSYTEIKDLYDQSLEKLKSSGVSMSVIQGRDGRIRTQQALELAPLATAIKIAEGSYNRAKDLLDDFAKDWADGFAMVLNATQMKINALGSDLTHAQQKARDIAQAKLDFKTDEYNNILATQKEVKALYLMYPKAGIKLNDTFENAYRKVAPYVTSEKDMEEKLNKLKLEGVELDILLKKKSLKSGGGASPSSYKEWSLAGGEKGTGMSSEFLNQGGDNKFNKERARGDMLEKMNSVKGRDGKIAPENWNAFREAWQSAGGNVINFDKEFSQFINMSHSENYFRSKTNNW